MLTKFHIITTVLCLAFCLLFATSCSTPGITSAAPTGKIVAESTHLKAVIVPLTGKVASNWFDIVRPYFENNDFDAIILWVESPGGGVTTTKILAHQIDFLKAKYHKTVIVYTERLLASGAYWIACSANQIYAAPSAMVGSIGVYQIRVDAREWYKKAGIILHYIASNTHKVRGNVASEMTPEERDYWQARINKIYLQFLSRVWSNRTRALIISYGQIHNIPNDSVMTKQEFVATYKAAQKQFASVADGSVYDSEDAQTFGLIDGQLYLDELVKLFQSWGYTIYNMDGVQIFDLYIPTGK